MQPLIGQAGSVTVLQLVLVVPYRHVHTCMFSACLCMFSSSAKRLWTTCVLTKFNFIITSMSTNESTVTTNTLVYSHYTLVSILWYCPHTNEYTSWESYIKQLLNLISQHFYSSYWVVNHINFMHNQRLLLSSICIITNMSNTIIMNLQYKHTSSHYATANTH